MNIKLKPHTNGDLTKPKWVEDDAMDQLQEIAKLAQRDEARDFVPDPEPPAAAPAPKPKPRETVNVKELLDTLLEAYTSDDVRMWVTGNEIRFEQVVLEAGKLYKNSWTVAIAYVRTAQVRLIK